MLVYPIDESDINDYFDIVSHKSTFLTLKSIMTQKDGATEKDLDQIDARISFYENLRKQWWTDILNKYNYPYFSQKKTYISRTRCSIVVE